MLKKKLQLCLILTLGTFYIPETYSDSLADYYLNSAQSVYKSQDIRRLDQPFNVVAVIRKFTLDSRGDTTRLDTAIVRATYNFDNKLSATADSIHPDTVEVLRDSYLEDRPTLTVLFTAPLWESDHSFTMFPDDPSASTVSIDIRSLGDSTEVGFASGVLTLDRNTSQVVSTLEHFNRETGPGYSRDTSYRLEQGYLIPDEIIEHSAKYSFWGSSYFVIETRVLTLQIGLRQD